ncbi:hypothetical protein PV682_41325 [Streptomyces niveiscabiei]|uniref:hypothetical protein n=1 Tax=Streptomyces niveiscabiei TaxID=164115 RepID=UPI0029A5AA91|nr:hypothetical protein [Streptomyces niveiscabiei]MDX3387841.1 hypothetical protein [Streptomyces niveiscabiei]
MSATLTPARGGLPRTVLRLHRTALLIWAAFVVVTLGWLVWSGEVDARSILDYRRTCDDFCTFPYRAHMYSVRLDRAGLLIGYVSLAVAAFAGGALIGRELESGTAHLAWTQGVSPTRWLAAKLAVPALAVGAGSAALTAVYRWNRGATDELLYNRGWSEAGAFVASGPAATAYALCALAVGVLAALLTGRTLPALATAFGATALVQWTMFTVRPHLWPTVTRPTAAVDPDPLNSSWVLATHGTTTTYHPKSHFWPLHLMETGLVLTLAATATAAAFWLLHRRTAPWRRAADGPSPRAREDHHRASTAARTAPSTERFTDPGGP